MADRGCLIVNEENQRLMKQQIINIPDEFPLKMLMKIGWFFPLTLSLLVCLMTAIEQGNLMISVLTTVATFTLLLTVNFASIFFMLFLFNKGIKSGKLLFYTFLFITVIGTILGLFSDLLTTYLNDIHFISYQKRYDFQGMKYIAYQVIKSGMLSYFILMWQGFILSQHSKVKTDLENAALKITNAQAANQLLRQQIHPHFLFNALSTIKSLIHKQPDIASDYVVRLSSFLRASISATQAKTETLAEEIKLSLNYLELQKIRLGNSLEYTIDVEEKYLSTTCLPVFSLQSLVENAVKHNLHSESSPLSIMISVTNGIITVKNTYNPHYNQQNSIGSGLNNLSERYKYLSGEKISFYNDELNFYVSLKLINIDFHTFRK